jgi:hypothetical protein
MLKELGMGNETRLLFHFIHVISPRISQNNIYLIIKSFDFLTIVSYACMLIKELTVSVV